MTCWTDPPLCSSRSLCSNPVSDQPPHTKPEPSELQIAGLTAPWTGTELALASLLCSWFDVRFALTMPLFAFWFRIEWTTSYTVLASRSDNQTYRALSTVNMSQRTALAVPTEPLPVVKTRASGCTIVHGSLKPAFAGCGSRLVTILYR